MVFENGKWMTTLYHKKVVCDNHMLGYYTPNSRVIPEHVKEQMDAHGSGWFCIHCGKPKNS